MNDFAALKPVVTVCMLDQCGTVADMQGGRVRRFGITPHQPGIVAPRMTELADAMV